MSSLVGTYRWFELFKKDTVVTLSYFERRVRGAVPGVCPRHRGSFVSTLVARACPCFWRRVCGSAVAVLVSILETQCSYVCSGAVTERVLWRV